MQHTTTPFLTINVSCKESIEIKGHRQTVVMAPFDGSIRPQITTDSPELGFLESEKMYSEINPVPGGVIIKMFRG